MQSTINHCRRKKNLICKASHARSHGISLWNNWFLYIKLFVMAREERWFWFMDARGFSWWAFFVCRFGVDKLSFCDIFVYMQSILKLLFCRRTEFFIFCASCFVDVYYDFKINSLPIWDLWIEKWKFWICKIIKLDLSRIFMLWYISRVRLIIE